MSEYWGQGHQKVNTVKKLSCEIFNPEHKSKEFCEYLAYLPCYTHLSESIIDNS